MKKKKDWREDVESSLWQMFVCSHPEDDIEMILTTLQKEIDRVRGEGYEQGWEDGLDNKQPEASGEYLERTDYTDYPRVATTKVKPEKQEGWRDRLGTILNDNCIDIIDKDGAELKSDIERFISQLLSERTFTKEELKETKRWYWNLHYCQRNNSTDKLKSKISKLLEKE